MILRLQLLIMINFRRAQTQYDTQDKIQPQDPESGCDPGQGDQLTLPLCPFDDLT